MPAWPRPLQALLAAAAAALVLSAAPATSSATSYVPSGFAETDLATGLNTPVNVAWAPDGHMFIAERQGIVMVHNPGDSASTNHQLLDISDHVNSAPDFSNDRGLLGIAVDKDFATNHFLYLLYTYDTNTNDDNTPKTSTLTRVSVNDSYSAAGAETPILGKVHPSNGICPAPSNTSVIFVMKTQSTMYIVACAENSIEPETKLMPKPSHARAKKRRSAGSGIPANQPRIRRSSTSDSPTMIAMPSACSAIIDG